MRLKHAFLILSLVAMVLASGCSSPGQATPTPATTLATVPMAAGPESIGIFHSTQVKVTGLNISYARLNEQNVQAENISVTVENTGDTEAQNVGFSIMEKDLRTNQQYFGRLITLDSPLPAYSSRTINVTSPVHEYAFSVIINIRLYWGEKVEFWNGYNESRTLAAIPWG